MFRRQDRSVKAKDLVTAIKSLLVPVNGTEASLMAVEFACSMAKRAHGSVHIVHVIEVKRSLALDAELVPEAQRGEDILNQADVVARGMDFPVEGQGQLLYSRDAGHAIVDEALERQVDAIVLGVPFRRPFGEFELGKVASHVLKSAHCQVVLMRMPND